MRSRRHRKFNSSTLAIFRWVWKNIAIVLGISPARRSIKRCNRRVLNKTLHSPFRQIDTHRNMNNNNQHQHLGYGDSSIDQRRLVCILADNQEITERIEYLLEQDASISKYSRIVELQELIPWIQSSIHQDASTMTNGTSCIDLVSRSENARRLKALEFIRLFLENNEEDFHRYLIQEEHLCQRKTFAIHQMIKQFLTVVYQSEYVRKQKLSSMIFSP